MLMKYRGRSKMKKTIAPNHVHAQVYVSLLIHVLIHVLMFTHKFKHNLRWMFIVHTHANVHSAYTC